MVARGIHIPRHDMVLITWKTEENGRQCEDTVCLSSTRAFCPDMGEKSLSYSYRCCPIHPDDHTLLIGGHFLVDVDTLLHEDQHGHCRHEGQHRVQDDAKYVQLWRERREITTNEPSSKGWDGTVDQKVFLQKLQRDVIFDCAVMRVIMLDLRG